MKRSIVFEAHSTETTFIHMHITVITHTYLPAKAEMQEKLHACTQDGHTQTNVATNGWYCMLIIVYTCTYVHGTAIGKRWYSMSLPPFRTCKHFSETLALKCMLKIQWLISQCTANDAIVIVREPSCSNLYFFMSRISI